MPKKVLQSLPAVAILFLITYGVQVVMNKSFAPRFNFMYIFYAVMGLLWLLDDVFSSDKNDNN